MKFVLAGLLVLVIAPSAFPDTIQLQSGGRVEGVVLKEADEKVIVHLRHGMVTLNQSDVLSVTKDESVPKVRGRIAPWTACFRALAARPWGADLRPLPAMIISGGTFRNVPYTSDRSGSREFNLYGDPDRPAGLEIGLSKELLRNQDARKEALSLLEGLLVDPKDREALASLDLTKKDSKEADGLTVEIDETQDSAGVATCFIALYDSKALQEARVPEKDVPVSAGAGGDGKPGSTVAAPAAGGATRGSPGSTTAGSSSSDSSGNFGFSQGALAGSTPTTSSRTYSTGGANWALWWLQHHPPSTTSPAPAPATPSSTSPTKPKPKPGTKPKE